MGPFRARCPDAISCRPTLSGLHVTRRRTADHTEIDNRRRTDDVWPDHEDRSPRCSTHRVRWGGDLRRGCTSRGPGGGGHEANPKARQGPPRADAPDGGRGDIATEPSRTTTASHRGGSRERAASSLPETTHASMTGRSFSPSASLRPGSPKKASRCIATSLRFLSRRESATQNAGPGWPPSIVADRRPAASREAFGVRSSDRKRSGADEPTALPRIVSLELPRVCHGREAQPDLRTLRTNLP